MQNIPLSVKQKYHIHGLDLELEFKDKNSRKILTPALGDLSFLSGKKCGRKNKKLKIGVISGSARIPAGFKTVMSSSRSSARALRKLDDFIFTDGRHAFKVERGEKAILCVGHPRKNNYSLKQVLTAGIMCLLRSNGLYPLHASGAICGKKKLLILGNSGSGKSTLTLSLILGKCKFLSDDLLLLRANRRGVQALSGETYLSFDRDQFSACGFSSADTSRRKEQIIDIAKAFSRQCVSSFYPDSILFLNISGNKKSRLAPIPARLALFKLFNQSVTIMLGGAFAQKNLDALSVLSRQADCFQLTLGKDLYSDPLKIKSILSAL